MTPAEAVWAPDAVGMAAPPDLVIARRDPVLPLERDGVRAVTSRVLADLATAAKGSEAATDFPLPDRCGGTVGHPVRFRDNDEPTVRRSLTCALSLRPDGSNLAWAHFSRINLRFAAKAASLAPAGATVMVIADGLYLVPRHLRRLRPDVSIVFVLLEELPSPSAFLTAPGAVQLVCGMLGADVVWFRTDWEASRFEVTAIALDLAEASGRSVVHLGRAIELRAG